MTAAPDTPGQQGARGKAAFGFIFANALLNAISFGLMIPVLPNLIKQFTGGDAAEASEWNVVFAVTWGVMQFFTGPILGVLSDRVGRRPVILISLFGLAIDFLVMALAPNLWWLLIGRVLNGVTASTFSTASAYVADITPPAERARAFGWLGAAFSFGFLAGPAIGGFLGEHDLRLPFYVSAAVTFANALYGLFILPESLPAARRTAKLEWKRANPVASLALLRSHPDLTVLAMINFTFQFAITLLPNVSVLYLGYRYGWGPGAVGLVLMGSGLAGLICQSLLVGPVIGKVGERKAVILGASCAAGGLTVFGLSPSGLLYLAGQPIFAGSSFLQPGLQSLMSQRVSPSEQGQLQGANQSLMGLAAILGPPVFGLTFAWAISNPAVHMPGLAHLIGASLMGVCGLLAVTIGRRRSKGAHGA